MHLTLASVRDTGMFLNGKFSAQPMTGVQRVASELVRALDGLAPAGMTLLQPGRGVSQQLHHIPARSVGSARLPLHLWEQGVLPWAARRGWLVNLAGAAPALAVRQVCVLHDAAVFDHPEAYTPAFRMWYRWLFRWLVQRGARLATVSAFSRTRLCTHLGIEESRVTLLPNGGDHLTRTAPDTGYLQQHGLLPGKYLLAVGSANPTKNLDALVRAFARLDMGRALPLVIVGGSRPQVFAPAKGANTDNVLRTGAVDDAPLKALYQGALGLVFPSLYEGFGLPPLEAMSCDCPVVAADAASIPEVCGDAAIYFDPRSEAAMAAAMARLVGDAALRERLRVAGRRRVGTMTWRASAQRLQSLLQEVRLA